MVVMEGSGSTGSMKIQPRDDGIAAENAPSGRRRRCVYAQIGAVYAVAKRSMGSVCFLISSSRVIWVSFCITTSIN
ncbi:hypothetical protein BKA60DRAFT_564131 [Fusarium oxysporum]|nr:hypothetical protein BKA60DRAFT_564131 [Fusarium oxysporum]